MTTQGQLKVNHCFYYFVIFVSNLRKKIRKCLSKQYFCDIFKWETKQIRVLGILLDPAITKLRSDKITNNPQWIRTNAIETVNVGIFIERNIYCLVFSSRYITYLAGKYLLCDIYTRVY